LEASIARQGFVQGNAAFAAGLAGAAQVEHWDAGAQIFGQGDPGQELFLILAGEVQVLVNGRTVATLGETRHFGEMSVIDPGARRSAAVQIGRAHV
jgi:CRP-like cAMP-binding protein